VSGDALLPEKRAPVASFVQKTAMEDAGGGVICAYLVQLGLTDGVEL
jgi:hypothetical protein